MSIAHISEVKRDTLKRDAPVMSIKDKLKKHDILVMQIRYACTNYVHITQQIDDSIQMSHRIHIYVMGLQLKLYI